MQAIETVIPYIFALLIVLSMLIYVILDGFDLGVGVLSYYATDKQKDNMIASIGPFWDANETWLVLGIGLMLIAFPSAYGFVLTALYIPIALMLVGIILRGVAFDFRSKAKPRYRSAWNSAFFCGSLLTSLAQGYMLGSYVLGFQAGVFSFLFSLFIAVCLVAVYCLMGASWLIMKTKETLQKKSVLWARKSLWMVAIGIAGISLATPMVSSHIYSKWFSFPNIFLLSIIPITTAILILITHKVLQTLPRKNDEKCWFPFFAAVGILFMCSLGLGYSFFPYIVPEKITIAESASATQSLLIILAGTVVVFPILIGYTYLAYKIFHGKSTDLTYD